MSPKSAATRMILAAALSTGALALGFSDAAIAMSRVAEAGLVMNVVGEASKTLPNDEASLTFSIEAQTKDSAAATEEVVKAGNAAIEALKVFGDKVDVRTTDFSTWPMMTKAKEGEVSQIGAWSARQSIRVTVRDNADDPTFAYGKQRYKRGGMWYTAQSGIWQTVWLESVPQNYIRSLHVTPLFDAHQVEITVEGEGQCTIDLEGKRFTFPAGVPAHVPVQSFRPWSPEHPTLYPFSVTLGDDTVYSYFAMRKCSVETDKNGVRRLFLNGKPYFHNGLLDQGYWPDGLYTAPSDDALVYDIQLAKDMGFNMLRKHIKVECDRWYYHCDRLGMLVWQDMPCGGKRYDPLIVSTPLVTGWHLDDSWYPLFGRTNVTARKAFLNELRDMVTTLYNHPCIAVWVPFNEGWGQFDSQTAVQVIRSVDKTRTIDPASGWHDQGFGDVRSLHVYFQKYRFQPDKLGRATLLSEFGGYVHRVEGHAIGGKSVGYKTCDAPLSLEYALQALYDEQIRPAIAQGLSAAVYTQLSDVEHELNGLVTYDRSIVKLPVKTLHKIFYIENE